MTTKTRATKAIKVLLVEDHTLLREGTKALLQAETGIEVVGETDNATDALLLIDQLAPDVVLLDIRLKSGNGIDVARTLYKQRSPTRVLVVTSYDYEQYIVAMTRAGVSGYVLKDIPPEDLIRAIQQVHEGHGFLPGKVAATVLASLARDQKEDHGDAPTPTVRELQILEYLMHDLRNGEIAERMGVGTRTIESHLSNLLFKLGAASRAEAVRIALERGYLKHNA